MFFNTALLNSCITFVKRIFICPLFNYFCRIDNFNALTSFEDRIARLLKECKFRSSRSQGPGGQNVNKLNTRIELSFNIQDSKYLDEEEKMTLISYLGKRVSKNSILRITSQSQRSQLKNRQQVISRFVSILSNAFRVELKRVPTRPTRVSSEKRLKLKKLHSEKKILRKKPEL